MKYKYYSSTINDIFMKLIRFRSFYFRYIEVILECIIVNAISLLIYIKRSGQNNRNTSTYNLYNERG